MISFKLRFFALIILATGCAGTLKVTKKEKEDLKVYSLTDGKGRTIAKVRASKKPAVQSIKKGGYRIEVPFDQGTVRCTLKEAYSPSSIWMTSFLEKLKPKVSSLEIVEINSGVIKKWPYLYSEVAFRSGTKSNKNNLLKILSLSVDDVSIFCLKGIGKGHQNLKQVVGDIISSLKEGGKSKLSSIRSQVDITSIKDINTGFVHREVFRNKKGNLVNIVRTSMIVPKNRLKNSLKGFFNTSIEVTDDKGSYLEGSYIGYEDLQKTYKVKLKPIEGKNFELTGTVNEKSIKKLLKIKGSLMTAVEQDRVFAHPQEGSSKSITFYDYVPSIDPLKIFKSKLVYKGIEKTGLNLYSVELNKTNLNLKVDSKGTPIFSSSKFGNFVLENRRVFLEKKRF